MSTERTFSFIPGLDRYVEGESYLSSLHRWESGVDPLSKQGMRIIEQMKEFENERTPQLAKDK
ncbi:MAG: hypothetical protein JW896_17525 [Deltaproteobacteria bacterium]|nr:hypothetical protein [Deltaproteobacteria bacterium]